MRNAYLDDLRDQNYKEAVAAEWKEIRAMDAKKTQTTPFRDMLETVLDEAGFSHRDFAAGIGISASFLCDLLQGKRGPSPKLINKICDYMGRGPKGRREWHIAGARTDGWEI